MPTHAPVTVKVEVPVALTEAWLYFTSPEHIVEWNFASTDWWCPFADSYLRVDGRFKYRMEAREGGMGFDFAGTFTHIEPEKRLEYLLDDGRKVKVLFADKNGLVTIVEDFEPENTNSIELQRLGWQAILNNFATYAIQTFTSKND